MDTRPRTGLRMNTHARPRPHLVARGRGRRRVGTGACRPGVAAERRAPYDAADGAPDDASHDGGASVAAGAQGTAPPEAPFGLPVLGELPSLATVLDRLTVADTALLDAVAGLADLLADDTVERTTGVGVEHWLGVVGAQTRMDRRLLLRACRLLGRLPSLDAAVRSHRVSFAQLRGLTIGLRDARRELDGELDQLFTALLAELGRLERPDPDALVRQMVDAVDELDPADLAEREREADRRRFLDLQPRLDGTGGRLVAELDAAATALLDAVTTPSLDAVVAAGGYGAARLDLLLARLAGSSPPADDLATDGAPADAADALGWSGAVPAPRLLVRLPFEALLDEHVPADLLTTLTGGRLRVTSQAARQLVDRAGARLRTVVVDDDGAVLGVGRASRQPPGWLSDVLAAVHDTCTGPGCDRAARGTQVDHAVPWQPVTPDAAAGTTDLDNLGPLCATTNRAKESVGWRIRQRTGGVRTWVHPRTGLATTTIPSTWRPPDDPRRRRPPRPVPPGLERPGPDAAAQPEWQRPVADGDGDPLPF